MKPIVFASNPSFWFETLRSFSHTAYGGADFGEVLLTAQQITPGDYDGWHDGWFGLGQRLQAGAENSESGGHAVSARDTYLRSSNYYRNAEFYLHGTPDDPRINRAFNLSIEMFQRAAKLFDVPIEPVEIPFEGTSLPGYFYSAGAGKRPTVVVCSGFDGTVEENHFYGAAGFVERGYHVLSFDGPGQPGMMHREGMVFRHDWEVPTEAVLDYLLGQRDGIDADRIAMMGVSMGGYLAPRAAAYDSRIKAVIAFDGCFDLGENFLAILPGSPDEKEAALLADSAPEIDQLLDKVKSANPAIKWAFENGQWVLGAASPRELLRKLLDYNLSGGIAEKITCPTLVLAGKTDLFLEAQPEKLFEYLTCEKTFIMFTEEQAADAHVQVGAMRFTVARIGDWLDTTFA
jgi:alpha-beta hydrolase superfamily lysophospholipase